MPTDHNIRQLIINKLTDEEYDQAVKNADELYLTPYSGEGGGTDLPDQTGQSGKFLTTNGSTLSWANVPEGTVTSVRVQATSPVQSSTSTAQSSTLNTTISLANGYGDTKNPYGTKNVNYVLAGPSSGSAAEPTFRALVKEDIPLASEIATSGGTTTSLVTTGEKYIWDNKQDALTTQTAYTSKGTATKVPQITTNNLGQVTGITEVDITQPTVNNSTILLTQGGVNKGSFTLNQATGSIIDFDKSGAELIIVDNSGSTLPTPQTIGETFLNTTDKKIYTAEAGEYVVGSDITKNGNLDLSNGEMDNFSSTNYLSSNSSNRYQATSNLDIHFKTGLDVTTKQSLISMHGYNSSQYRHDGLGAIYIENNKLYVLQAANSTLTEICDIQINKDYHIEGSVSSSYGTGYFNNIHVKENDTYISTLTTSAPFAYPTYSPSSTFTMYIGVYRGSDGIITAPLSGVLYGDTNWGGTILVSEGETGWDDGTALINDAICQDETNNITYLYQNNNLININELPAQSGQSGKFLTTDGSTLSWATVSTGTSDYSSLTNKPSINSVTLSGNKTSSDLGLQAALTTQTAYTSKGTATKVPQITTNTLGQVTGITEVDITYPTEIPSQSGNSGKFLTTNGTTTSWAEASPNFYGVSDTAAATVQKEVSIPSITTLNVGQMIIVQPTITSTVADSTIKLNNFTAYPMRYNNAAITTSTDSVVWNLNYPSFWVFDGTYWVFAGHGLDSNTTYTLNYSVDAGKYTAGSGSYAVTRYSIIGQKANGTWEKITSTSANYSTGTSKTINTNGFILNQLRYYGTTTTIANGAKIATNVMYEKAASVDMRYSTNCGGTTTWAEGDYIYLVGTIGSDGLFYLDTTTWWTNSLPSTNDGKLYIRLGLALAAAGYTMSFFENRPIFYHNGTKICEYKVADNKQDNLPSQSGNSGKFLTTDGTTMSWATVSSGGANVLFFTNVVASDWVTDNTYAEYEYKCVLTCTGVSENDYAQVVFNPTQSISGNYANICLTGTNSVTIYSKINTAISIPTITIFGSN